MLTVAFGGLVQLVNMQNELQKQMAMLVAVPVGKEGKRLEGISITAGRAPQYKGKWFCLLQC